MHKVKKISVPLYRGQFMLIVSDEPNKVNNLINQPRSYANKDSMYASAWLFGYGKKQRQTFAILLNFNNIDSNIHYGTIAHEVEHIKNMIFEERGAKTDPDDDETQAYLVEWITDKVYEWLKEMNMIKHIKFL